jgi:hypothetical protein
VFASTRLASSRRWFSAASASARARAASASRRARIETAEHGDEAEIGDEDGERRADVGLDVRQPGGVAVSAGRGPDRRDDRVVLALEALLDLAEPGNAGRIGERAELLDAEALQRCDQRHDPRHVLGEDARARRDPIELRAGSEVSQRLQVGADPACRPRQGLLAQPRALVQRDERDRRDLLRGCLDVGEPDLRLPATVGLLVEGDDREDGAHGEQACEGGDQPLAPGRAQARHFEH